MAFFWPSGPDPTSPTASTCSGATFTSDSTNSLSTFGSTRAASFFCPHYSRTSFYLRILVAVASPPTCLVSRLLCSVPPKRHAMEATPFHYTYFISRPRKLVHTFKHVAVEFIISEIARARINQRDCLKFSLIRAVTPITSPVYA